MSATMQALSPRCRYHVATPMVPVRQAYPSFVGVYEDGSGQLTSTGARATSLIGMHRSTHRVIWKCPVALCPVVAILRGERE